MQYESFQSTERVPEVGTPRRVLDGLVRGIPDCWVMVPRDEYELIEWFRSEEVALESAPMRVCRAILDDGLLVLEELQVDEYEAIPELF